MPWTLLGIILAVCAILCAVGFYKFVYFLSIGYGFAVAGGGIAGTFAAVSAAREGGNVLLVESGGCLGGTLTSGFVPSIMDE